VSKQADVYESILLAEKSMDGGRTVLLRITNETPAYLFGVEIKPNGDEIKRGVETQHIIEKSAIKMRLPMIWNKHYGILERTDR